jgi:hypothetical protein
MNVFIPFAKPAPSENSLTKQSLQRDLRGDYSILPVSSPGECNAKPFWNLPGPRSGFPAISRKKDFVLS